MGKKVHAHERVSPVPGLFCGVDVGASATKVVLIDESRNQVARVVLPSGVDYAATAQEGLVRALTEAGVAAPPADSSSELVTCTVATGYGRSNVAFADGFKTEIHCHGLGCHHLVPGSLTIVDIGCQDNKVIRLEESGRRVDFKMNRKCAAGTGAFIEEIAVRLDLPIDQMDPLARSTDQMIKLSSFCTVFAKTEILAHLRRGVPVAQIVRGAFDSVINRIMEMDPLPGNVVLTGGVAAYNGTITEILSNRLEREVVVPPHPQMTGALGAALAALSKHQNDSSAGSLQEPA